MIYSQNVFVCLAIPPIIAALLLKGETRRFLIFFTLGLLACLLCAYINSFITVAASQNGIASLNTRQAMTQITPICEEIMKVLPVFFYMAAWQPRRGDIVAAALAVGLGFATFENCCFLTEYGASDTLSAIIRGASTGAVHATCAAIMGFGLVLISNRRWLIVPGAFALLCVVTTFHAIYNMLVAATDIWRALGHTVPLAAAVTLWAFSRMKKEIIHAY